MVKYRVGSIVIIIIAALAAYFVYNTESPDSNYNFKLGLDLSGGTHLIYKADISLVPADEVQDAMSSLQEVIERRVNLFGVSEPIIQVEQGGVFGSSNADQRLIVELPGVTDIEEAIALIGKTPLLEFMILNSASVSEQDSNPENKVPENLEFISTGLTGGELKRAQLEFGNLSNEPIVTLIFTNKGREMFSQITKENVGEILAIFLDGVPISTPVIREEIKDGTAQISGSFNPEEAKELVRNLNYGALPVPIELISTQTIGASLGDVVLSQGVKAGIIGLILISIFIIFWYRFLGVIAVLSLAIYVILMLTVFKLIPVTLTAAGLAGFIISIGMAIDANIILFERIKEELSKEEKFIEGVKKGFSNAWSAIRDGNTSTIMGGVILFWFGTSLIEGFALTLIIGVILSMLTAIFITRTFLISVGTDKVMSSTRKFLFGVGLRK